MKLEEGMYVRTDKGEIKKLFEERYTRKHNTFGVTEESYGLLEVNVKIIATDRDYLKKSDK